MYSILIADNNRWKFLTNTDGTQYIAETLLAVQEKVRSLAQTIALNSILVVKNCTITESIVVTENVPEPENIPEENNSNEENGGE